MQTHVYMLRGGEGVRVVRQVTKLGDVLTNSAFMAFLLLVSLGWTITRNVLTRREVLRCVRHAAWCPPV